MHALGSMSKDYRYLMAVQFGEKITGKEENPSFTLPAQGDDLARLLFTILMEGAVCAA